MIIYKDIIAKLKEAGYNTNKIRKEKIMSEGTLTNIRQNRCITTDTLNLICKLTGCTVEELIEYVEERKE